MGSRATRRAYPDLIQGLADLQSAALTTELYTHVDNLEEKNIRALKELQFFIGSFAILRREAPPGMQRGGIMGEPWLQKVYFGSGGRQASRSADLPSSRRLRALEERRGVQNLVDYLLEGLSWHTRARRGITPESAVKKRPGIEMVIQYQDDKPCSPPAGGPLTKHPSMPPDARVQVL